jgi:MFS transporter, OFA family, oxalate/formate antiporter
MTDGSAATVLNLPLGSLYAFSIFLQPLERALGVTRAELSFVFGLATVGFIVGMNLAPTLFRLLSPARIVLACAASNTAGLALSAAATDVWQLALGYGVLFGLGGGVAYITVQQGVNLAVRSRLGLLNGYIVSLYPAGAMLAAPIFGGAIALWGLRPTLAGLAAALGATGLAAAWLVVRSGMTLPRPAKGATAAPAERRLLVFWRLWFVFFLAAAAGLTVLSQAAGMIAAYGGSATLALFATTYITGCIAAARLAGGWLIDRFAAPFVMAGAHAFALAGDLALTLWPGPLVAVFTLAMVGMGYGVVSGSTAAAVTVYWSIQAYGRIASRLYIAWCVAAISLPIAAGRLFDLTGDYRTAVLIAGGGNLLGVAIAAGLPRRPVRAAAGAGAA